MQGHLPGAGLAASFRVSARSCQRTAPRGRPHRNPKRWTTTRGRSHLRSGLTGRLRGENAPLSCLGCEPALGPQGLPLTLESAILHRVRGPRRLAMLLSPHQRWGADAGPSTTGHVGRLDTPRAHAQDAAARAGQHTAQAPLIVQSLPGRGEGRGAAWERRAPDRPLERDGRALASVKPAAGLVL